LVIIGYKWIFNDQGQTPEPKGQVTEVLARGGDMKILVIEDGFNHLAAARTFFATKPDVQVAYATTYSQARKYLAFDEPVSVDGIISDIFFPYHHESPHNNPEPIGVAVMIQARDKGIPCILNTAGYHHGSRYQWISGLQSELGLPQMVDQYSDDQYTEAEGKDWNKAYNRLVGIIGVAPLPSLAAHIKTGMEDFAAKLGLRLERRDGFRARSSMIWDFIQDSFKG
jgi:hypothetical protein